MEFAAGNVEAGDEDKLSVTAAGVFDDANVGTGKNVTITGITLVGDAAGSYKLTEDGQQKTSTADIIPKEAGLLWDTATLTYNGEPQAPDAEATGLLKGDTCGVVVSVEGEHSDAGEYTAAATLKNDNYCLPSGGDTTQFTIARADHEDASVTGAAKYGKTGEVDLSDLIENGGAAGEPEITANEEFFTPDSVTVSESILSFTFADEYENVDKEATVRIPVTGAKNYKDYGIIATLTVSDKDVLTLRAEDIEKTYDSKQVAADAIRGTATFDDKEVPGTWSFENGETFANVSDSGVKTAVFTPEDTSVYYPATTTLTLTITPAEAKITALDKTIAIGEDVPAIENPKAGTDYDVEGLLGDDTLTTVPELAYDRTPDNTKAGTYVIAPSGAAAGGNYKFEYVNGKLTIVDTTVHVTGVTLDQTTLSLTVNATATLTATVAPEDATDKTVTWTSDKESVAKVDENGKVTAVAAGTAIITATAADGKSAACTVTVTAPAPTPDEGGGSGGSGSGGGSAGGGGGGTSSNTTTTDSTATDNADGSKTNTTSQTTTTKNADGSTTAKTTETATTTATDGSKTETKSETSTTTKQNADGTTTTATMATETATTTDANGVKTTTETRTEAKETLNKSGSGTVESKTTETVKDAAGKVVETTVTESKGTVETAADGAKTTVTTNTATTTDAEGNVTTTVTTERAVEAADGSTGSVVTNENGETVSASATISKQAVSDAAKSGEAVTVPVTVTAAQSAAEATAVEITVPQGAESVKVEIPVEDVKPGTVAVIVKADGAEEIVKTSTTDESGVVLTLDAGATVKIVDNTKTMKDVSGDEWYADSVAWATSHEVMNGVGDGSFDADANASRGTITQLLMNLDGGSANGAAAAAKFSDVSESDWFADSVAWATENGVAQGAGESFGANDAVTREDLAVMIYNYAQYKGYDVSASGSIAAFPDAGSVSGYAQQALTWAVGAGLISGTTDENGNVVLDPQGTATRAQIAAIIRRFCENVAK